MILPAKWELQQAATEACFALSIDPYASFQQADGNWVQQWELMAEDIRRHLVVHHAALRVVLKA